MAWCSTWGWGKLLANLKSDSRSDSGGEPPFEASPEVTNDVAKGIEKVGWWAMPCQKKKKKLSLLLFLYQLLLHRLWRWARWMQKHSIKIARGHGSQFAGIMTSTSFCEFFCYCTHCACNGTTLYFLLLRCIAPHILLKITTHSLTFYFSPIFWCGMLGTCQEGENVGRH